MPKYRQVKPPVSYPGKIYPDGRVLEHHLVWWQNTGEVVPEGYVVHHKNEDGKDNRFENLELKEHGQHTSHHCAKGEVYKKLVCAFCGKEVVRLSRDVRSKNSQGQKRFYCSKQHAAKYQHSKKKKDWRHGTRNGYRYHKCRCDLCKEANNRYMKEYNKKQRAARLAAGR